MGMIDFVPYEKLSFQSKIRAQPGRYYSTKSTSINKTSNGIEFHKFLLNCDEIDISNDKPKNVYFTRCCFNLIGLSSVVNADIE